MKHAAHFPVASQSQRPSCKGRSTAKGGAMDDEAARSTGSHLEEGGESTHTPPLTPWTGIPSGSPIGRRIPSRWAPRVDPHGKVGRKDPLRVPTESRSQGSPSPSMDRPARSTGIAPIFRRGARQWLAMVRSNRSLCTPRFRSARRLSTKAILACNSASPKPF